MPAGDVGGTVAVGFLRVRRPGASFWVVVGDFVRAGDFLLGDFLTGDLRAGDFLAGDRRVGDFLAGDLRAGDFRAGDLRGDRALGGGSDALSVGRPRVRRTSIFI